MKLVVEELEISNTAASELPLSTSSGRAVGDVKLEKSCGWSSSPRDITKRSQNSSDAQTIKLEDKNVNIYYDLGAVLQ